MDVQIIQDMNGAVEVIRHAGAWLRDTGKPNYSKWWNPDKVSSKFLRQYARPDEFYVARVAGKPAAAAIIQSQQTVQDWSNVDKGVLPKAMYVHWVSVEREFAGRGLVKNLIDQAEQLARQNGCDRIRLDTYVDQPKLRSVYESLGFRLVGTEHEDNHITAFYEKLAPSK